MGAHRIALQLLWWAALMTGCTLVFNSDGTTINDSTRTHQGLIVVDKMESEKDPDTQLIDKPENESGKTLPD